MFLWRMGPQEVGVRCLRGKVLKRARRLLPGGYNQSGSHADTHENLALAAAQWVSSGLGTAVRTEVLINPYRHGTRQALK